jgi:hypothetical protein
MIHGSNQLCTCRAVSGHDSVGRSVVSPALLVMTQGTRLSRASRTWWS